MSDTPILPHVFSNVIHLLHFKRDRLQNTAFMRLIMPYLHALSTICTEKITL